MRRPYAYGQAYETARSIPDLFELVKRLVEERLGRHRAGLMLGLTDLGLSDQGFIGAFFMVGGNAIVVNRQALQMVKHTKAQWYKPYLFYLLLHEYLHAVGILDEAETRRTAARLCNGAFGREHAVTVLATDHMAIMRTLVLPEYGFVPPEDQTIELIPGFDRSSWPYIM